MDNSHVLSLFPGSKSRLKQALHHPHATAESVALVGSNDPAFCWGMFQRVHHLAPDKAENAHNLSSLISLLGLPNTDQWLSQSQEWDSHRLNFTRQAGLLLSLSSLATQLLQRACPQQQQARYATLFFLNPLSSLNEQLPDNLAHFLSLAVNPKVGLEQASQTILHDPLPRWAAKQLSYGPFSEIIRNAWRKLENKQELTTLFELPLHELENWFDSHPKEKLFWRGEVGAILISNCLAAAAIGFGRGNFFQQWMQIASKCWRLSEEQVTHHLNQAIVIISRQLYRHLDWSPASLWLSNGNFIQWIEISELPLAQTKKTQKLKAAAAKATENTNVNKPNKSTATSARWEIYQQRLLENTFNNISELFQSVTQTVNSAGIERCAVLLLEPKHGLLRSRYWRSDNNEDSFQDLSLTLSGDVTDSILQQLLKQPCYFAIDDSNREKTYRKLPEKFIHSLDKNTLLFSLFRKQRPVGLLIASQDIFEPLSQQAFRRIGKTCCKALDQFGQS